MDTEQEIKDTDNSFGGCPIASELGIDLFKPGSQEHWFEDYITLHNEAPISKIPGGGWLPGTDAFVLTKFEDIAKITRDPIFSDFSEFLYVGAKSINFSYIYPSTSSFQPRSTE